MCIAGRYGYKGTHIGPAPDGGEWMDLDEPFKSAAQFGGNREHDNRESYEGGSKIDEDKDEYLSPENEDGDESSKTTVTTYSSL